MSRRATPAPRAALVAAAVAVALGTGGTAWAWGSLSSPDRGSAPVAASVEVLAPAAAVPAPPGARSPSPSLAPAAAASPPSSPRTAPPVRLRIPRIGVDTRLERLRLDRGGALEPPRDPDRAGWYAAGARPGDVGPAVVAGHLDSTSGPAVFARLGELRPGDRVEVRDADGGRVRFRVVEVREVAKAAFPTEEVYGPTPDAELHLVTCAGGYVRGAGGYLSNVLVTAVRA